MKMTTTSFWKLEQNDVVVIFILSRGKVVKHYVLRSWERNTCKAERGIQTANSVNVTTT
jgi:hypothetical protein